MRALTAVVVLACVAFVPRLIIVVPVLGAVSWVLFYLLMADAASEGREHGDDPNDPGA